MQRQTRPQDPRDESRGLWLGLLGVAIFALTLPMTRLAVGPAADPQLPPLFVTAGRAAFAGLLALAWLLATRAPRPRAAQLPVFAAPLVKRVEKRGIKASPAMPEISQYDQPFCLQLRHQRGKTLQIP